MRSAVTTEQESVLLFSERLNSVQRMFSGAGEGDAPNAGWPRPRDCGCCETERGRGKLRGEAAASGPCRSMASTLS
jgi:hypothetical protein